MEAAKQLPKDIIDIDVFEQLLEMDEEDDREFSKSLVWNYFEQAESTFEKMDAALAAQELKELSTLGHFLKGSSAAVGVTKVRNSCDTIQHYGNCQDADGMTKLSEAEAFEKLKRTLEQVKEEYKEAKATFHSFFDA